MSIWSFWSVWFYSVSTFFYFVLSIVYACSSTNICCVCIHKYIYIYLYIYLYIHSFFIYSSISHLICLVQSFLFSKMYYVILFVILYIWCLSYHSILLSCLMRLSIIHPSIHPSIHQLPFMSPIYRSIFLPIYLSIHTWSICKFVNAGMHMHMCIRIQVFLVNLLYTHIYTAGTHAHTHTDTGDSFQLPTGLELCDVIMLHDMKIIW